MKKQIIILFIILGLTSAVSFADSTTRAAAKSNFEKALRFIENKDWCMAEKI